MNIVVTGVAGFIGFHLAKKLLQIKGNKILSPIEGKVFFSKDSIS